MLIQELTTPARASAELPARTTHRADYRGPVPGADAAPVSFGRRIKRGIRRLILRAVMATYCVALAVIKKCAPRPRAVDPARGCRVLLTGTFYSENWVRAHLRPLAAAANCSQVYMVAADHVPELPKVTIIRPPVWLEKCCGRVPARLLTFLREALRLKPDLMGGFHLLINGLVSAIAAPLLRARSIYFCVGGPMEVIGGGVWAENKLFSPIEIPDAPLERRLLRAVRAFDVMITMGTGARDFYQRHGVSGPIHVVPGGIDSTVYAPAAGPMEFDLITVGRLARIKRFDIFLHAVKRLSETKPDVKAAIVGDGELRDELRQLAKTLGIEDRVTFAGHQRDVRSWLNRARVFVLCSDSEGLALSIMEATMAGLPVVASDVGDLGDMIDDGVNGFLVASRDPAAFAARIAEILHDADTARLFSENARRLAMQNDVAAITAKWEQILTCI